MADKKLGGMNFDGILSDLNKMANQVSKGAENVKKVAGDAGDQVAESFVNNVGRGIDEAANQITASSVKITKAFRDLAKKITNQKDIFSVSLGSQNIALDIDFSDVDINSEDFKRRVDKAFEKFKIDNAIKFDSKAAEKQFKDMLGLHIKYAEKLSNLQAQAAKPIKTSTKGKNAQSQLAVMSGLEDIQNKINQAAGKPVKMPRVYLEDSNVLKDRVHSMETELKVEERVGKQRDTNVTKLQKEKKELKEKIDILEQEKKLLEEKVGPIAEGELPPTRKPKDKKSDRSSEEIFKQAEEEYDRLSEKLNTLRNEAYEAEKELEKLQKRALVHGFGSDKTPAQEGRIQSILAKNNRGKYVTDMLKKGYQTTKTSSGEYGFDRPDLGKGVFTQITKTEYEYAQYLSAKIKELNVDWDEGLRILESQNGQLEAAKAKIDTIRAEEAKTQRDAEVAYKAQAEARNKLNATEDVEQNKVIDDQNTKLEERNRLINEYIAAEKKAQEIESKYGDRFRQDVSLEDYNEWSKARMVQQEISMHPDSDEIQQSARVKMAEEQKRIAEETANIEAKADGQSVVAEQTELDLTEEELKIEKEITAENEKQAASAERLKEIKKGMSMAEFNATHYDKNIDFNQDVAISNKSELLSYLGDNPEQTENELKLWKQQIENRVKPVNETVSRISKMSAVPKELNTTKLLYQEAAKVGQQIQTMYDDGITDTEEYIALQYKLLKIFDKIAYAYGGVKGSGAKDRTELNQWMYNALKEDTGFDFYGGSLVDALYSGQNSIYDDKGKKLPMKDKVANLLNYDSGSFTGVFGFYQDLQDLQEINTLLDIIEKRRSELFNKSESTNSDVKPNFIKTNDTPNKFKADQGVQTSMDDMLPASAEDITPKVESEVKGLDKVGEAAERTAESKNKLADANKKVADSAIETDDEGGKNIWTTSRSGESLDTLNLPVRYVGENGQNAVQMFAGLKSQIEEMTGKPVIIEFASNVNENGELEAIGATLKYVNEEAGVTVKQFYDIERGEGDMLIATQSYEKATLSKTKAAKAFNTEMQRKVAEAQIKTLETQMGELKLDLTDVKKAASDINDQASLDKFNLELKAAKEEAKQLKAELKGQNALDTIATMERSALALPSELERIKRKLEELGNVNGAEVISDVLKSVEEEYNKFLTTDESEDKTKAFRSLSTSMTWIKAEMKNLSDLNSKQKKQETQVEKEELAKQKAARESYINWWKSTLEKQEKEEKPYRDYGKTTANSAVRKRDNLQGEIDALGVTNPEILAQIDAYKDKVQQVVDLREEFAKDPNAAKNPASVSKFQKISAEAERARKSIKAVIDEEQKMMQMSEEQGFSPVELSVDQIANLKNTMIDYAKSTKQGRVEIKGWNDDNTKMYYTVTNSKGAVEEMTMAIGQGTNKMYQYRTATKETGTLFQQVFKGIKVKAKELLSFVIGGGSIYKVISLFRQGIQYVREIDLALTELKKVTDETEESYDRFLETAAKTAEKVGSTIQKVVSSTADWARLGYSMKEAAKFAETTQILMNVSEFTDVSQATDTLISSVQAFGYTAETSMEVVDLLNTIGNNYAISTADLAQSLTKSSASLVAAGGDLAEAAALTATANKIIQDADSVGTALKTTSLRLRGTDVKVLEEEGLDSDGAVASKSKLQGKVKALSGVDILTATGEYKSTYEILSDIADVWESINDMDQAALLELISGKRNSSVIAAILQNPEELKAAFEDANNAEGSAAKELEKYLDSIQGKIDQFTNSVQSMWSNILNADVVKWFVERATGLIQTIDTIIDTIGVIPSILLSILTYKTAIGLIKMFDLGSIGTYISLLFTANNVTEVQGLLINKNIIAEKLRTSTLIQAQAARMGLTAADLAGYSVTQLLILGVKGLAAGFKNLWIAMGPVGWIILGIIAAVTAGVAIFDAATKSVEELKEEFDDLKSELSDIESDINSLNSELKTTQERMAELIAMPSLSFVEQEELEKLQQTTAELERQIQIQEAYKQSAEKALNSNIKEQINTIWDGEGWDDVYAVDEFGVIIEDEWNRTGKGAKEALDDAMVMYESYKRTFDGYSELISNWDPNKEVQDSVGKGVIYAESYKDIDIAKEQRDIAERNMQNVLNSVHKVFSNEAFKDLKYGDDEEINKFLDEYYAYQYKWQEAQGISAKSSAIASIFDDTSSSGIKKLKEDLTAIAGDDTLDAAKRQEKASQLVNSAIRDTSGEYDRLKTSMDIVGITADEVAGYFAQMSQAPDSSTVEGLTAQYQKGVEALSKYKGMATDVIAEFTNLDGSVENITWGSLFDKDGKAIDTQISKVLQGANETTRTEFARIAQSVHDETMSIEQAITSFSGSGLVSVSKLIEESFGELNKSVFKDLEDDISGFIDTFSEFSAALEDVANSMELLNTAQEQFDNSGQVSVKTALELVESTDRWNEILYVENGQIKLNTKAQDILAQSKLDTVKANLAEAKASIQNQLAQLGAADATLLSAEASDVTTEAYTIYTNAMNSYSASIAGFGAALDALVNGRIFGDDGIISSFQSAYDAAKEVTTYENNTNIAALREQLAEVQTMEDFFKGVDTVGEFDKNYDFDKTPGDKSQEKKQKDDAFQREMDYWENRLSANQARADRLENTIDLLEQKGMKASAQYYRDQMTLLNSVDPNDGVDSKLELLNGKLAAVVSRLNETTEGSEEWWEAAQEYNDIVNEIQEIESAIVDMQDAIAEIDTYKFEEFNTRLDNLINKLETIGNLIAPNGEEDWFDDEGNWTEAGVTVLGKTVHTLGLYKQGLEKTKEELEKYNEAYSDSTKVYYENLGIHSEQEYYDKVDKLTDDQYKFAESISDTEQSIVDMYESNIDAVEEYIETLVDGYNDYIDSVKEALDAERDLYEFKKNVQKQAKDIAELERRIASLSGSTNKSEIAERRKLEAQLYEARESLNDTYYDHVQNSQDAALDAEQSAYEETMNKFIEGMRTSLETATQDMKTFLGNVTTMVSLNAGTILEQYQQTKLPLDDALTSPWEAAKEEVGNYSGDALELMNTWTQNGFLTDFPDTVQNSLESPWKAGQTAVGAFTTSVDKQMKNVVSAIETNVKNASIKLSELYKQIEDTEDRAANIVVNPILPPTPTPTPTPEPTPTTPAKNSSSLRALMQTSKEMILGSKSFVDSNTETIDGVKYYRDSKTGYYYKISDLNPNRKYDGGRTTGWAIPKGTWFYTKNGVTTTHGGRSGKFAKGTTGTTRDQWAITDEPQFGDELVLVPGKDGNLSFMRKGTGVVPADMTQKLFELAQIPTSDLMNKNLTAIVPNITKNDFKNEFNFESLVHVDTVDSDTLPKLEKMVDKKIDDFSKALNYSIKRFAR